MSKLKSPTNILLLIMIGFILWQRVPLILEQYKREGTKLPDTIILNTLNGNTNTISLIGENKVFVFWATWCPPCKLEIARLKSSFLELKNMQNLHLISIDQSPDLVKKYLDMSPLKSSIDNNQKLQRIFNVAGTPTTILVNKDGTINKIWTGANPFFFTRINEHLTSR